MITLLLVHAGPTPWDVEDRIVGDHTLPLADEGREALVRLAPTLAGEVALIACATENDATLEAARIIGSHYQLKPTDEPLLEEMNLGLWEGLRRKELEQRYTRAFEAWTESPEQVQPPEGESLEQATVRIAQGIWRLVRRRREGTIILTLRPMAMQIAQAILHGGAVNEAASALHQRQQIATIELTDSIREHLKRLAR